MLSQAFFYGSENKVSPTSRQSLYNCLLWIWGCGSVMWPALEWMHLSPMPHFPQDCVVFLLPNPSLSCIHRICSLIWELNQRHCRFHNLTAANILILYISWLDFIKKFHCCVQLWDPMDYRVHGILQARILEWVAFPFSNGSSQPRDQTQVSYIAGGFFTC